MMLLGAMWLPTVAGFLLIVREIKEDYALRKQFQQRISDPPFRKSAFGDQQSAIPGAT
jgi:hypothetical protein